MSIRTFEDIIAWQKAKQLYINLSLYLADSKKYTYKDQILRASLSILNNIAEGFDRGSNKELKQFLVIARGSAAEVRSMLLVGSESRNINDEVAQTNLKLVKDISRLLTGFIKSLN